MTENNTSPVSPCPYDILHIYYLKGHIHPENTRFGSTFLGNWEEDGFSFLFFQEPADNEVNDLMKMDPELKLIDQYQMTYEEWQGGKIEPFTISDFLIVPPWDRDCSNTSLKKKLVLDPGVVFGTGTHPTTHDCLDILSRLLKFMPIHSVIDLGTGTGLLALAAAKLGCNRVLAVDFNFLAVQTTLRNIRLNGFEDTIHAFQGRAETFMHIQTDLMVANIHYDVMQRLVSDNGFLQKKWFILSGLLKSQAEKIEDQLSHLPVTILEKRDTEGVWHTFFGKIDP
ncbi:MAG: 50S ribosomal protein L11 methyltransferase [Proteobacteria bacterium]|nr:50S ribosomal protein L11 methyltransferase [Pseudomonadota bacterium]